MIEQLDEQLIRWAKGIVPESEITLAPPQRMPPQSGKVISIYLFDLAKAKGVQRIEPGATRVLLRYLVTAWAARPEEAHELLAAVAFAALDQEEFEVEFCSPADAFWAALGVPPQPAFVLQLLLIQDRPASRAKAIRRPLVVQTTPMAPLFGQVLTSDEVPLAGMRVELPALNRSTTTDLSGRFHFSSLPFGSSHQRLRILGKGRELSIEVAQPWSEAEPVVIHMSEEEK